MTKYPRILISGQYFHTRSGGGITLSNLFFGWDKDKIASTASFITNPSFEICDNYYQIGSKELKLRFPFNLKRRSVSPNSGRVLNRDTFSGNSDLPDVKKSGFRKVYDTFLFSSGLIHYRSTFKLSPDFLDWVKSFKPEIIYSQLSSLEEMRIVSTIKSELNLPLAIHIMDDWPSTISQRYFPKYIWRKIINKELIQLFSEARVLFSISEAMSEEYLKRYGMKFIPFHNPINTKVWSLYSKKSHSLNDNGVKILYSGRIGIGISQSLLDVAGAIESLNSNGNRISLHIQTASIDHEIFNSFRNFKCVVINPTAEYTQIPAIFSDADILLLANDFDEKAVTFLKYSMPTKASEYMISGTPILVYSAENTAVTKFFKENNCGHCVTNDSRDEIRNAILTLINNQDYRQQLSMNAVNLAKEKFDDEKVRSEFRRALLKAIAIKA